RGRSPRSTPRRPSSRTSTSSPRSRSRATPASRRPRRELFRLRAQAEERLGDRFDIKGFHDAVLAHGAVTLPILGDLVDEWVAARAA
ncbi:MAG TPA: DUF885 family protein, partial [Acidimicrobiales bacterium]|nr:DUF885 family protein [Acidimicrobiales bacterium]